MINKDNIKELTIEELKIYYNEFMRRYRIINKDKIISYNKKYNKKKHDNIVKKDDNILKTNDKNDIIAKKDDNIVKEKELDIFK